MSSRYTYKQAQQDITELNKKLDNSPYVLRFNSYYEYYRLTQHERATGRMIRSIESGTPNQCYTAALQFVVNNT